MEKQMLADEGGCVRRWIPCSFGKMGIVRNRTGVKEKEGNCRRS